MDCATARELYVEALAAGQSVAPPASRHIESCQGCRDEARALATTWAALGAIPQLEPSPAVARRLARRLRWEVAREALASLESWQRAALAGVAGFVLSVALSVALPYQATVTLCEWIVPDNVPLPAAYVLAGLLYGFVPMLAGAALQARATTGPRFIGSVESAAVFVVVLVPYVVLRCSEFPLGLLAGFMGGVALGALGGGAVGSALRRRPALA